MPSRAMAHKNNFSGTATPGSTMRTKVEKNKKDIKSLSAKDGISNEKVAEKVLKSSGDELIKYVTSKGEVPVRSISGLILQAALLRMEDISVISRSCNMSEYDAISHIEEAESEAVDNNTSAKQFILTPSTQAALQYIYNRITGDVNAATGSSGISGALDFIRKTMATPLNHNTPVMSDNFNYGGVANTFDINSLDGINWGDTSDNPLVSSTPTSAPANPSDSSNSIWDLIKNVAASASSIASSAKSVGSTAVSTASGLSGVLNGIGGGVGASAISQYLSANWWKILLFMVAISVIIIMIARAAKNK